MKRLNKKGFTIVELVIVIAVIGILAGVLIPTFAGMVEKADESAALQAAQTAHTELLIANDANLDYAENSEVDVYVVVIQNTKTYIYSIINGNIALTSATAVPAGYGEITGVLTNSSVKAYKPAA